MVEKIIVGPVGGGLKDSVIPVYIDNDSFPALVNAYQWRGRVKRKRGTSILNRLRRYFDSLIGSYGSTTTITLSATGVQNLITGFGLDTNGAIVPGSVTITVGANVYTDPASDGVLTDGGVPVLGTINYGTGAIVILAEANNAASATFFYYPVLPVLGLRDFDIPTSQFPTTIAFDNKYSYNITTGSPYLPYDVSFYKNIAATVSLPSYVQKTVYTPTSWNGADYQQFGTVDYQGALWTTNGLNVPFTATSFGMQFKPITVLDNIVGVTCDLAIATHGLVVGDFVFINEVVTTTGINFQTGYVIAAADPNKVKVEFPQAVIVGNGTGGICQYLTNRSDITKDCIRFYDGDPTSGSATAPTLTGTKGWVNFCPPISQSNMSIADLPAAQYYLVGAKIIVNFKDRLLFIGPIVQTSAANSQVYLQDTVIYSQNGTPYYTASFAENTTVTSAATVFTPMLVPDNQTGTAPAYFGDSTGFGGFISAGLDQAINTLGISEDVLIFGSDTAESRFVYTGNDIIPFNFYTINNELGGGSTFSTVDMDKGTFSIGSRGITVTNQNASERIDLDIPNKIFEMRLSDNGTERITAIRDFTNEWAYFTYPQANKDQKFNNTTLQYNYRDNSWATFIESYTTYGSFRKRTGLTWATVGETYGTWAEWNDAWNSSSSNLLQPEIIAGNQQGFIVFRADGTGESNSIAIRNISFPSVITGASQASPCVLTSVNTFSVGEQLTISGVVGMTELNGNTYTISAVTPTQITIAVDSTLFTLYTSDGVATPTKRVYSPDHTLSTGDYITISGALGTVSTQVNGNIFTVGLQTANGFDLNPPITTSTYLGSGLVKRMPVPFIQSKQFPSAWGIGRKTRLGVQQYLFSTTAKSQVTLLIYLSQNADSAYNLPPIVPSKSDNNALIYDTVLYTCPESSNLGLTAFNTNLQMISDINAAETNASSPQSRIWHRVNTSLIGDTVQIGITLSDEQMRDTTFTSQFSEIELHGFMIDVYASGLLS